MRRSLLLAFASFGLAAVGTAQGPMVLMGIDAEDFNISLGGHGGTTPYEDILTNGLLPHVTNGGVGVLVVGGGKDPNDDVTQFWTEVVSNVGIPLTFVNGGDAIRRQGLRGFAVIAIASALPQTPSGGLTDEENDALTFRAPEFARFVNGGGAVFGTSQAGLRSPYGYLGPDFFVYNFPPQFDAITPTAAGLALGITNVFDTCCWHDEYVAFPAYFDVLATNDATGQPCAIGSEGVVIARRIVGTPFIATCSGGETHTVTAFVSQNTLPVPGKLVDFQIYSGPNAGETAQGVTDAEGKVSFSYVGDGGEGVDLIRLFFLENGEPVYDLVYKYWGDPVECLLVVGNGPGADPLGSPSHVWQTQVSAIKGYYPATEQNFPVFELPPVTPQASNPKTKRIPKLVVEVSVQMLMWNPVLFPSNPEQYSRGLTVKVWSDGRVEGEMYGTADGINIWLETYTHPDSGAKFIRFPFRFLPTTTPRPPKVKFVR